MLQSAALLFPALSRAKESARATQYLGQMRQFDLAAQLYADDHHDTFPRSMHSAATYRELPWGRGIAPYLGATPTAWTNLLATLYSCPNDKRAGAWSHGQNVYFELGPGDDYEGSPGTWRRLAGVPRPVVTILQSENTGAADHIMPNYWVTLADATDVAPRVMPAGQTTISWMVTPQPAAGRTFLIPPPRWMPGIPCEPNDCSHSDPANLCYTNKHMKLKLVPALVLAAAGLSTHAADATANATNTFTVTGMHCDGCAKGITSELKRTPGVVSASASFSNRLAVVTLDTNRVDSTRLIKVIEEAGYKAQLLKP